jgi:hypothetical protein
MTGYVDDEQATLNLDHFVSSKRAIAPVCGLAGAGVRAVGAGVAVAFAVATIAVAANSF